MHCVSLGKCSFEECQRELARHPLVELRLDTLGFSLVEAESLYKSKSRIIATCRSSNVGDLRQQEFLLHAIKCGVAYVDLEMEASEAQLSLVVSALKTSKASLIISYHNFLETPESACLEEVVQTGLSKGADIVKIACMVREPLDNLRLLSLLEMQKKLVVVGMGEIGKITRIAGPLLGSLWTYVTTGEGKETADGQLSFSDYREIMNRLSITPAKSFIA